MEVPQQLPPQKQSIVTTQSVDKTLHTTKEVLRLPMEIQRLPVRMDRLEKDLALCNKKRIKLEKRFDILIDEIDDNTQLINKRFKKLEYKNIKESLGILDLENFNKSSDSESSDDDEQSEDSTDDKQLTIKEKFDQLEEKIESFKHFVREALEPDDLAKNLQSITIVGIQEEVSELTTDIGSLKKQTKSLPTLKEDIETIAAQFAAFKKQYFKDQKKYFIYQELSLQLINANQKKQSTVIETKLANFQEKYAEDQEELLQSTGKQNAYFERIIQEQSQSISTLRRWLIAMGGGSACALALFIWHYTHSK